MQHKTSKFLSRLSAAVTFGVLSCSAYAQLNPSLTPSNPFNCGGGVDCLIAGYGVNQQAYWLTQPPPDQAQSMAVGGILQSIMTTPTTDSDAFTLPAIINTLTTVDPTPVAINAATTLPAILVAPGLCTKTLFGDCANNPQADAQTKATNFSLNTLLGPVAYQTVNNANQQTAAQNFITWVSGITQPIGVIDFSGAKLPAGETQTAVESIPDVATYVVMQRTYTAQQAVGLSNLYELFSERVPKKGLGAQAGMPNSTSSTSESPLQIEQYLATRQIADPNWYTSMQTASPAAVSRATLFLLAELPPMLYQLHLDMERMTATLSVMEIQQTAGSRLSISTQLTKAQSALANAANASAKQNQ